MSLFRFRKVLMFAWLIAGPAAAGSIEPNVQFSLADELALDHNGNGRAEPGDIIVYVGQVSNSGNLLALAAQVAVTPGSGATLLTGSVVIDPANHSSGFVLSGNDAGEAAAVVFLGTLLAGGGTAGFQFAATIDDPLPLGIDQIQTQGQVTGANFTASDSIDPDFPTTGGVTVTAVFPAAVAPLLEASLSVSSIDDVNGNGRLDVHEWAELTVHIANVGDGAALNVAYQHHFPVHLRGSGGQTNVSVSLGDLAAATETAHAYWVRPVFHLVGARHIDLQGVVTADHHDGLPTDNRATPRLQDTTPLAVHGSPPMGIPAMGPVATLFLGLAVIGLVAFTGRRN